MRWVAYLGVYVIGVALLDVGLKTAGITGAAYFEIAIGVGTMVTSLIFLIERD